MSIIDYLLFNWPFVMSITITSLGSSLWLVYVVDAVASIFKLQLGGVACRVIYNRLLIHKERLPRRWVWNNIKLLYAWSSQTHHL